MANTDLILFGIAIILFGGFFVVAEALNYATLANWIPGLGLLISFVGLVVDRFAVES